MKSKTNLGIAAALAVACSVLFGSGCQCLINHFDGAYQASKAQQKTLKERIDSVGHQSDEDCHNYPDCD